MNGVTGYAKCSYFQQSVTCWIWKNQVIDTAPISLKSLVLVVDQQDALSTIHALTNLQRIETMNSKKHKPYSTRSIAYEYPQADVAKIHCRSLTSHDFAVT